MAPVGIHTYRPHKLGALYAIWNLQSLDMYSKSYIPIEPPKLYCVGRCIATERKMLFNLTEGEKEFLLKHRQRHTVFQMLLVQKRFYRGKRFLPEHPDVLFFEPDGINGWTEIQLEDLPLYFYLEGTPYLEEQTNRLRSLL